MVRELVQHRALVAAIAHGDADGVEARQDVQLGDHERGEPIEAGRVFECHEIEIPTAALAAGRGAELVAAIAKPLASVVEELRGEGSGADASGISLGNPPHLIDVRWADACAYARRAGNRIRGGDEGIGAVVEVEKGGLGTLEEDEAVRVKRIPADLGRVGDMRLEAVAVALVLLGDGMKVELRVALERAQELALRLERSHDLLPQDLRVEHVLDADAKARRLVGVAGADAALGRADLELPELRLARRVEHHVVRHDQVRVGRDLESRRVDAPAPQTLELADQNAGVDHDAVADRACLARVEDPRRDQVELELVALADDRVAGVVAALKADHDVGLLGNQVDDLALALIAPLGADYDDSWHGGGLWRRGRASPRSCLVAVVAALDAQRAEVAAHLDQAGDRARRRSAPRARSPRDWW